jgi:hypothetical protein
LQFNVLNQIKMNAHNIEMKSDPVMAGREFFVCGRAAARSGSGGWRVIGSCDMNFWLLRDIGLTRHVSHISPRAGSGRSSRRLPFINCVLGSLAAAADAGDFGRFPFASHTSGDDVDSFRHYLLAK